MDFHFNEDELALIEAARNVFDGEYDMNRLRTVLAAEPVRDLWPQYSELGLFSLLVPETEGGLAQNFAVMAAVAEAAAYAGIIEPLVDTAGLIVPLLVQMGEYDKLQALIKGEVKFGLVTPLYEFNRSLNDCIQVIVTTEDGGRFLDKAQIIYKPVDSIDGLQAVFKTDTSVALPNAWIEWYGGVLNAATLTGLAQRLLDMSVDYAGQRQQFGKRIGSFQAIKHQIANVYTQINFTRPMVHLAALKGGRAVHIAKLAATDTATLAVETAIQIFGAMGYTAEADTHIFMKRVWALAGDWGDRHYHMKKLENLILDGQLEIGAQSTFMEAEHG